MIAQRFSSHTVLAILCVLGTTASGQDPTPKPQATPLPEWQQQLEALGYLETVPVESKEEEVLVGVTRHDRKRVYPGYNLGTYRQEDTAILFDMDGKIVVTWHVPGLTEPWQHVELCDNGDLLVLIKDRALLRVSPAGEKRWHRPSRCHHDMTMTPADRIWVATRIETIREIHGTALPVLEDRLTLLDNKGQLIRRISFVDPLLPLIGEPATRRLRGWAKKHPEISGKLREGAKKKHPHLLRYDTPPDLFHLNSIEVLDRKVPGLCSPGDLLISIRNLDLIAVFDPATVTFKWQWGGSELDRQHHPTLLANNNLLIFDNGVRRRYSRVIELDPIRKRIVWEYRGSRKEPFFSPTRGSSQRLPNGNTLICETDKGRSIEVTARGEIVWEHYCPMRRDGAGKPRREVFFRLRRITERDSKALRSLGLTPMFPVPLEN